MRARNPISARLIMSVFKLRIGVAIMMCALAGIAVTPGPALGTGQVIVLALAVLISSAAAGAFNQYAERDLDARMGRTRRRPFVTGVLSATAMWPSIIGFLLLISVLGAGLATNPLAAVHVFLGAFTYGLVYTVWLKRRTWLNIVVGGLAGSFAVLAGACAVDPELSAAPALLALVLFLWTPPHFWSLAFAYREDYRQAGVPMLPVVVSDRSAARIIFAHTVMLCTLALVPAFFGMGIIYLTGALIGGTWFVIASWRLVRHPDTRHAMRNFHASLAQLSLLLIAAIGDRWLLG